MTDQTARLQALVERWRQRAVGLRSLRVRGDLTHWPLGAAEALTVCSDELAAVLAAEVPALNRLEPIDLVHSDRSGPISLNESQEREIVSWAADDRLWTTQETVEFNLRVFARRILSRDTQAQTLTALQTYVQHKPNCPHSLPKVGLDLGPGWITKVVWAKPCSCGLDSLQAALAPSRPKPEEP